MTAPARFYYGWVNVLVGAAAMTATLPGRTCGLRLVKEQVRADLGLTDERFAWLNFWAIVLGSAAVLPAGWLIDRVGTRLVSVGVSLALGASVLAMSRAADETQLAVTLTLVRGGQHREGVADHRHLVIPHPHPSQPYEPTHRLLYHPPHMQQHAAIGDPTLNDPGLDPVPGIQTAGRAAVVPPASVHHVRQSLGPPAVVHFWYTHWPFHPSISLTRDRADRTDGRAGSPCFQGLSTSHHDETVVGPTFDPTP